MNKKLILLILCLPLVLMLCLFSVTNTVSINVSIPVSKIVIFGDNVVYIDLDVNESYFVDYTVYPTNAKNKKVSVSTEQVGSSPLAELEYVNGKIIAKSCGKAKVSLTTIDGGHRDSFIVNVISNKLHSIDSKLESESIYVGETTRITTSFIPEDSSFKMLNYTVAEQYQKTVKVDASGVVTGLKKGVAEIVISSKNFEDVKDVVTIEIKNKDIIDLVKSEVVTWNLSGSVGVSLDTFENCEYAYSVYDENYEPVGNEIVKIDINTDNEESGELAIEYEFVDNSYLGDIYVDFTATTEGGLSVTKTLIISRIDQLQARFVNDNVVSVKVGGNVGQTFIVTPEDANITFAGGVSNENISINLYPDDNLIEIIGEKPGVSVVNLKIINAENTSEFIKIEKEVVVLPSGVDIEQTSETIGFEKLFAFGRTEVNGTQSTLKLDLAVGGGVGDGLLENIVWTSSSENVSVNNGIVKLNKETGSEIVQIGAKFSYKGFEVESEKFEINCVYDGLNIRNYLDLHTATNMADQKPMIIQNDIISDFAAGVQNYYKEIETTYDKTYYNNIGSSDTKIKVLIEFKNDVYGNGHTINAHNVAWLKNQQNAQINAVFNGPKNFVAMSETGGMVSVKAQDNVCFAVYENVNVTNITLKGCDLQADNQNQYDLSDLEYTGTTVEVFGDNVNIQYSTIMNGRTVLRAFGDVKDHNKVINVNISNCVLGYAREFILRLGTNCFVDGTKETPSPYLPNDQIKSFPMQTTYEAMSETEKQNYEDLFIKTKVTVKDSALREAGIFAIGLDSHFAGEALAGVEGAMSSLLPNWYDLAKTSYGVKLRFEGDVRLYNWKKLSDIDSSTLIDGANLSEYRELLKFDINEMISTLSNQEMYASITKIHNGEKYVHNGIAFFGGGKNYSVFESDKSHNFNGYKISLKDVGKSMLESAAGSESFYFYLNDATTLDFLPEHQEQILASDSNAYGFIYRK